MEKANERRQLAIKVNAKDTLPLVLLIVLVVFMGGNTRNPDIDNYIRGFSATDYVVEGSYLYTLLKNLFVHAGFSFYSFRLFLYATGLFNIHYVCKKMGVNTTITYVCYGIALMMIDATQTYNFLGMSLLLVGVSRLIMDEDHNRIRFIIFVLLASGFHIVFLFYLPFIFIYRRSDSKQLRKVYIFTTALVFLLSTIVSVSGLAGIVQRVLSFTGLDTYQTYLNARTRYGHYYPMFEHLISCAYSYYFFKEAEKNELGCKEICRIILLLNLYGIFAFPLFRFQLTIARLTRNLEMLTFISGVVFAKEQTNKNKCILLFGALVILAGIMGYFNVYSDYKKVIVQPFWRYNWILGGNS